MSIFDKLKFWEHKEEPLPDLGKTPDLGGDFKVPEFPDIGKSAMDDPEFGKPVETVQTGSPPFPASEMQTVRETVPNAPKGFQQPQWQGYKENTEMQVISAKLDALRASLDSINQRLENIERIAEGEQPRRRWQYK